MKTIDTLEQLEEHYGLPMGGTLWKEIDHINGHYRQFIEKSPFLILATMGEKGIDCSPRGDPAGFVRVVDNKNILIPDRRGNNRVDSLRNIVANPDVGLIFLIPNIGETLRLSGKAKIIVDEELCASFSINNKPASSIISISVEKVYFQCQKAIVRSKVWDSESHVSRDELPSVGEMAKELAKKHGVEVDAHQVDKEYPERVKKTIY